MRYQVMERYPLQQLSLDDLQAALRDASADLHKWRYKTAARAWRRLARLVQTALEDALLLGAVTGRLWVPIIEEELARIRTAHSAHVFEEVYTVFLTLLDRVYGALHRLALRNLPTAFVGGQGYFRLERLRFVRPACLPGDARKSPLLCLMEFIWQGGPRIEAEFVWEPLGKGGEARPALERRRQPM